MTTLEKSLLHVPPAGSPVSLGAGSPVIPLGRASPDPVTFARLHGWLWGRKASWFAAQRRHAFQAFAPAGDSAFAGSVFNLVNAILGAGIVSVPYFFVRAGWLVGTIMVLLFGWTLTVNMAAFVRTGTAAGCDSYPGLTYKIMGARTGVVTQTIMLLSSIGSTVGHCVIVGDIIVAVASYWMPADQVWRRTILIGIFVGLVFPLALRRDLNALRGTSFVGFLAQVAMVVAVFIQGSDRVERVGFASVDPGPSGAVNFVAALPLVAFLFSCSSSVFPCYVGFVNGLAAETKAKQLKAKAEAGAAAEAAKSAKAPDAEAAAKGGDLTGTDAKIEMVAPAGGSSAASGPSSSTGDAKVDEVVLVVPSTSASGAPAAAIAVPAAAVPGAPVVLVPAPPTTHNLALAESTVRDYARALNYAHLITGTMFLSMGLFGAFVLGDQVTGNVLKTFAVVGEQSRVMLLCTILYGAAVLLTAPLSLFSQRISLHYLVFGPTEPSWLQHNVETTLLLAVGLTLGVAIDDVSLLFSFLGSISSATLAMVVPAAAYLIGTRHRKTSAGRAAAVCLVCFGSALAVMGVTFNILRAMGTEL